MAVTADQQSQLDDIGKQWNAASGNPEAQMALHDKANDIRNSAGLVAGTDYNAKTGAAIQNPYTPATSSTISTGNAPTAPTAPTSSSGGMLPSQTLPGYSSAPTQTGQSFTPDTSAHVTVNGQDAGTQQVMQGRTFESVQNIAKQLNLPFSIDPKTGLATIGGKQFQTTMYKNGSPMVGLRNVAEAHGYDVSWDPKNSQVTVTKPQEASMGMSQIPQMPQVPQLQQYQQPDESQWYDNMMGYQQFQPDWNQYYSQAHGQLDPQYTSQYNNLMAKQGMDINKMDEGLNAKGIFNSGIAVAAENDLRAKTTNAVASVFMKEQGAIEKLAMNLYNEGYKQAKDGNDFALKNNQQMLSQAMNDKKMQFDQYIKTQNLTLSQYNYALKSWNDMSNMIMKNAQMQMQDQHFQQNLGFNQFKFDNLSANQQVQAGQGQQKIDLTAAAQQASNYFKQMGINLSTAQLQELIRSHQANESLAGARINADMLKSSASLQEKTAYDKAMIDKASASAMTQEKRVQLDSYKAQLSSITTQIGNYVNAGHPEQTPPSLMNAYNATMDKINSIIPQDSSGSSGSNPSGNSSGYDLTP